MQAAEIIAVVTALVTGAGEPAFEPLREGGHDERYPVAIEQCELPPGALEIEGRTVICGTVDVPEDYDNPEGRRIPLEFAVLKARTQSPAPDPVFYLHGGPGGGTLQMLGPVADILYANHRRTRDVVTFDQRAAALSSRTVACYEEMAENVVDLTKVTLETLPKSTMDEMVEPCVREIQSAQADLSAYNTENNARDVRAIADALGYDIYNIYGISYGTKLALEVLRTAPDGVRSVVIDGVAPPQVKLYDDLIGPYADTMDALADQCASDEACDAAYPDLRNIINAAFMKLASEPIPAARGREEIGFEQLYKLVFEGRNHWRDLNDTTRWLPRILTELAQGMPDTFDALQSATAPDQVKTLSERKGLTPDEKTLVRVALEAAEAMDDLEQGVVAAINRLKSDLNDDRELTSIAEAFEARSTQAAIAISDENAKATLLRDYALLQSEPPNEELLTDWVRSHFDGDDRRALLDLVAAMEEADLERTFEIARGQATKYESVLSGVINMLIYACQEDVPYNTVEGFKKRNEELANRYEFLQVFGNELAFYKNCETFEKHPRPGFHEPVVSDVPVLAMNGVRDIQTSWRWGAVAVETLKNGQNVVVPEAGHGSIAYQPCANDITVAFINDPSAELNVSCIERIKVDFVMPDDPLPK